MWSGTPGAHVHVMGAPIDNGAAEAHYDYLNVSFGSATSSQLLSFCSGATEPCTNSFRAAHLIHSERYYALGGF